MSEEELDPVVTTEAYVPLPDQTFKAKLADGTVIGSSDTEQSTIQIACAYYTAIMIINPKRPYQIGVYSGTNALQAVIGRGA